MSSAPPRWSRYATALAALLATALAVPTATATADDPDARAPRAAADIPADDFQQVPLALGAAELGEPMSLAVLPDRSVLHTSRDGTLRLTDAAGNTKTRRQARRLHARRGGPPGRRRRPGLRRPTASSTSTTRPPLDTPAGDAPDDRHGRRLRAVRRRQPALPLRPQGRRHPRHRQREEGPRRPRRPAACAATSAATSTSTPPGNLYLSTGDDTNPFDSDGYTPIDERADRNPAFDAQRSSGNTNDLRGKVLRIKVDRRRRYTVPTGNLFAPGTDEDPPRDLRDGLPQPVPDSASTRPPASVYLGDYGPDAGAADPNRGPGGQVEFARVTKPGNFGWPYCTGNNTTPYVRLRLRHAAPPARRSTARRPEEQLAAQHRPDRPAARPARLDPVRRARLRRPSSAAAPSPRWAARSTTTTPTSTPPVKFPRGATTATSSPASSAAGGSSAIEQDGRRHRPVHQRLPVDRHPGHGHGLRPGRRAVRPRLRHRLVRRRRALRALPHRERHRTAAPRSPRPPPTRTSGPGAARRSRFSSAGTTDPDGDALTYAWDFGDGGTSTAANPTHTYTKNGTYTATLTVKDPTGRTGTASVQS